MNPLLQIRDLQTWFPIHRGVISRTVGNVRAVDGVSLDIYPNETLSLVGESGCGKSTLARTIALLEQSRSGTMHFSGQALSQAQPGIRRKIQMIFQDPYSSLNPRMTVLEILTEGLVQHRRIKSSGRVTAAREILADVGMDPDVLYRYPHEFSGGQRQRISIGRALSLKPELLICDEAVSALDVSVQAQVINLLLSIRRKHGLSYLFISHDLGVVRHMADRVAVMYLARNLASSSNLRVPALVRHGEYGKMKKLEDLESCCYLRMSLKDHPCVLAQVAQVLGENGISIASVIQNKPGEGCDYAPVIVVTHRAPEKKFRQALRIIDALDVVGARTIRMAIEDFE